MSSHNWADVWKVFLDVVSRESIAAQIAIGLGAAFAAVMTLEGIRASFFPKRIVEAVALRAAASLPQAPVSVATPRPAAPPIPAPTPPEPQEDMRAAWLAPVEPVMALAPPASSTVHAADNTKYARRSSPRRMRVIGQRRPSQKQFAQDL